MPTIAIIGASRNRAKFGNKAVRAFKAKGYTVYPINPESGEIEGLKSYKKILDIPCASIDRVSVYLPPHLGLSILEEIVKKKPKEVWLNPGSESPELVKKAKLLGLPIIEACSIVGAGMSPNSFSDE